jgi:hypothetical protein
MWYAHPNMLQTKHIKIEIVLLGVLLKTSDDALLIDLPKFLYKLLRATTPQVLVECAPGGGIGTRSPSYKLTK